MNRSKTFVITAVNVHPKI